MGCSRGMLLTDSSHWFSFVFGIVVGNTMPPVEGGALSNDGSLDRFHSIRRTVAKVPLIPLGSKQTAAAKQSVNLDNAWPTPESQETTQAEIGLTLIAVELAGASTPKLAELISVAGCHCPIKHGVVRRTGWGSRQRNAPVEIPGVIKEQAQNIGYRVRRITNAEITVDRQRSDGEETSRTVNFDFRI